jgi:hypothetical protein
MNWPTANQDMGKKRVAFTKIFSNYFKGKMKTKYALFLLIHLFYISLASPSCNSDGLHV